MRFSTTSESTTVGTMMEALPPRTILEPRTMKNITRGEPSAVETAAEEQPAAEDAPGDDTPTEGDAAD